MIDVDNITKFNCTHEELEERILFWVLAAGKNGQRSAIVLDNVLKFVGSSFPSSPFTALYNYYKHVNVNVHADLEYWMAMLLQKYGSGCHWGKGHTWAELIESGLDLHTCTVDDLEMIKGIGPKTARCFIMHSRPNQEYAGLDTHVLKYLRSLGHNVPKSTPTGNAYKRLEKVFLDLAKEKGKTAAEFDLEIWTSYRKLFNAS